MFSGLPSFMGGNSSSSQSAKRPANTSQGLRNKPAKVSLETFNMVKDAVQQLGVECSDDLINEACAKFPNPDVAIDALLNH